MSGHSKWHNIQAKKGKTEETKMGNIGTNLHELFELLRTFKGL